MLCQDVPQNPILFSHHNMGIVWSKAHTVIPWYIVPRQLTVNDFENVLTCGILFQHGEREQMIFHVTIVQGTCYHNRKGFIRSMPVIGPICTEGKWGSPHVRNERVLLISCQGLHDVWGLGPPWWVALHYVSWVGSRHIKHLFEQFTSMVSSGHGNIVFHQEASKKHFSTCDSIINSTVGWL